MVNSCGQTTTMKSFVAIFVVTLLAFKCSAEDFEITEFNYKDGDEDKICYQRELDDSIIDVIYDEQQGNSKEFIRSEQDAGSVDECKQLCCEDGTCNTIIYDPESDSRCFLLDCSAGCHYKSGETNITTVGLSTERDNVPEFLKLDEGLESDTTTSTDSSITSSSSGSSTTTVTLASSSTESTTSAATSVGNEKKAEEGSQTTTTGTTGNSTDNSTGTTASSTTEGNNSSAGGQSSTEDTTQTLSSGSTSTASSPNSETTSSLSSSTGKLETTGTTQSSSTQSQTSPQESASTNEEYNSTVNSTDTQDSVIDELEDNLSSVARNITDIANQIDKSSTNKRSDSNSLATFALVIGVIVLIVITVLTLRFFYDQYERKDYSKLDYLSQALQHDD